MNYQYCVLGFAFVVPVSIIQTGATLYVWGLLGLISGVGLFRILQYFGIMDLESYKLQQKMQAQELAQREEKLQFYQMLQSVLRFENIFKFESSSSEESSYFLSVAKNKGLPNSDAHEKLSSLISQSRELRRRIDLLSLEIDEVVSSNSSTSNLSNELSRASKHLNKSQGFQAVGVSNKYVSNKSTKKSLNKARKELKSLKRQRAQVEAKFSSLINDVFSLLDTIANEFWEFFLSDIRLSLEELAYMVYEFVTDRGSNNSGAYQIYLNFVDTIAVLSGKDSPEMLYLSDVERKAIERLNIGDEVEWIEEGDLPDITVDEIREYKKKYGIG